MYVCVYAFSLTNKLNQCFQNLYPPAACSALAISYTTRFMSCNLSHLSRVPLCAVETLPTAVELATLAAGSARICMPCPADVLLMIIY